MAYVEVEIYPEEYLDEVSTDKLQRELARRKVEPDCPLPESPAHIISDLKKAHEAQDHHEFYFLVRKIERLLEAVDG